MALDDLGGLGDAKGPSFAFTYAPPSLMPELLPWLVLLSLLLLPRNRHGQAWWIGVPLLWVLGAEMVMRGAFSFMPSQVADIFSQVAGALAFGLGVVWLLAPYLGRKSRVLTALLVFAVAGGSSLGSFLLRQDWSGGDWEVSIAMLIPLGLLALVVCVGLSLAAFHCRRRYHPLRLLLWMTGWVVLIWAVVVLGFAGIASLVSGSGPSFGELVSAILVLSGVNMGAVLPFLLLSFSNRFYTERLKHLLGLPATGEPPAEVPPVVSPASAG